MSIRDSTNVSVILYTSKTLSNGEHPLMVRVTRNGKRKYVSTGISCSPKFWDKKNQKPKRNHPDKDLLDVIISKIKSEYQTKILELKNEDKEFSANSLVERVQNPVKKITVFEFFDEVIDRMIKSKQIGNSNVYRNTKNSLLGYVKNKQLLFSEITFSFLSKYETYLRSKGIEEGGLSIYFRTLKALYNKAIVERYAKAEHYPFKEFKTSKFKSDPARRAITLEDFRKIENLNIKEDTKTFEARQYFLMSFYGMGINFTDIALLQWSNIQNGRVYYTRRKTGKEVNFKITPPIQNLLDYWKPFTKSKSGYVFPILNKNVHKTPIQIDNRIHKVLTRVNKELKEIGRMADLEIPLTTYVARHTFATALKNKGTNTAVISEAMGHRNQAITEAYLKSFDNDTIDKAVETLL